MGRVAVVAIIKQRIASFWGKDSLEGKINYLWIQKMIGLYSSRSKTFYFDRSDRPEFPYWDAGAARTHYEFFQNYAVPEDKTLELECEKDYNLDYDDYNREIYRQYLSSTHCLIRRHLLKALTSRSAYVREWASCIKNKFIGGA